MIDVREKASKFDYLFRELKDYIPKGFYTEPIEVFNPDTEFFWINIYLNNGCVLNAMGDYKANRFYGWEIQCANPLLFQTIKLPRYTDYTMIQWILLHSNEIVESFKSIEAKYHGERWGGQL